MYGRITWLAIGFLSIAACSSGGGSGGEASNDNAREYRLEPVSIPSATAIALNEDNAEALFVDVLKVLDWWFHNHYLFAYPAKGAIYNDTAIPDTSSYHQICELGGSQDTEVIQYSKDTLDGGFVLGPSDLIAWELNACGHKEHGDLIHYDGYRRINVTQGHFDLHDVVTSPTAFEVTHHDYTQYVNQDAFFHTDGAVRWHVTTSSHAQSGERYAVYDRNPLADVRFQIEGFAFRVDYTPTTSSAAEFFTFSEAGGFGLHLPEHDARLSVTVREPLVMAPRLGGYFSAGKIEIGSENGGLLAELVGDSIFLDVDADDDDIFETWYLLTLQ